MSILLLGGLPEEYEGVPISPDFRNMIQVDLILQDPELSPQEKAYAALNQLYPEIPADHEKANAGLVWFFTCGAAGKKDEKGNPKPKSKERSFDFDQDANKIYAAFYATYGINLATIDFLHWWEFMALFEGLPEDTLIRRVIYWRTADTSDMSKEEKSHINKMRSLYALKRKGEPMSVEEVTQKTKEHYAQRAAERIARAQAALDRQKQAEGNS